MPASFPCPNPTCPHDFSPEEVQGATSLVCPRCGAVFQFRAAVPPPPKPAGSPPLPAAHRPTGAKPPVKATSAPTSRPVRSGTHPPAPPPPTALPVTVLEFQSTPNVVVPAVGRRSPPRRRSWLRIAVLVGFVAAGAGLAAWAGVWIRHYLQNDPDSQDPEVRAVGELNELNCQFNPPGAPWKADRNIRLKLHVNLGLSRDKPRNNLGLFVKDYKTRSPSEAELVDEALGKLRAYLPTFEWELKPKNDGTRLGDRPALRLEFVGVDAEQVPVAGECCIVAHRGFAYWLFTWGPDEDKDALAPEWQALRKRFGLLNHREGWREQPRATDVVFGSKGSFRLSCARDLWKKKTAQEYGPLADVVLEAFEPEPGSKPHAGKAALFYVFVLPKTDSLKDAVTAARAYLDKRLREEENHPRVNFETVKEKGGIEADRDTDLGKLPGHLIRLHVTGDNDVGFDRYMVLGVVQRPEGDLVFVGDCHWERRDFWEQEFAPVLASLQAR
jgi:hypothetical protein